MYIYIYIELLAKVKNVSIGEYRNAKPISMPRVVFALILREMSTTYGRSAAGYIWAIVEPVIAITLLTLIFSLAFRTPSLGVSFPLFYATGYLPYTLYSDVSNKLSKTIQFSRPLLYYPAVTYVDALLARFILNFFTQIMISYLVIAGVLVLYDTLAVLNFHAIFSAFLMAAALSFGVGTMNCFLNLRFPVWERIWAILNRPLFIISTILFTFEIVPPTYREYLWYNPLVHIVGEMRRGFYATYDAAYVSYIFVYLISGLLTVLGLVLLKRHHQDIAHR